MCLVTTDATVPAVIAKLLFAALKAEPAPRPTCVLPFGLRRQPHCLASRRRQLLAKLPAIIPGNPLNRQYLLFALEVAGVAPHHGLPLYLRHLRNSYVKRLADRHLVRWLLVSIPVGAPHRERAGRDELQLHLHAAATIKRQGLGRLGPRFRLGRWLRIELRCVWARVDLQFCRPRVGPRLREQRLDGLWQREAIGGDVRVVFDAVEDNRLRLARADFGQRLRDLVGDADPVHSFVVGEAAPLRRLRRDAQVDPRREVRLLVKMIRFGVSLFRRQHDLVAVMDHMPIIDVFAADALRLVVEFAPVQPHVEH